MPNKEEFKEKLHKINEITNVTERAIETMLYIMKSQLFWDGNKRSAMLFANHEMIKNGVGIITIPVDIKELFGKELIYYYETNNMDKVKKFIYDNCIDGAEF